MNTIERMTAKEAVGIGYDFFIYLPEEKKFFKVDDSEHDGKDCNFYFEEKITLKGIEEFMITFNQNKKIVVFNFSNR